MSHSEVSICNDALAKLGASSILSLADPTKNARLCNSTYATQRNAVLRLHNWAFAMKRATLAQKTTTPVFGFANEFGLPSDCIRVFQAEESSIIFKIEGNLLLTDEGSIKILYISRVEDPEQFNALFVDVLATRIARELALPIADSRSLMGDMDTLYKRKLAEAKNVDGMEGKPDEAVIDTFLRSRM